jgi:hypothetical protein
MKRQPLFAAQMEMSFAGASPRCTSRQRRLGRAQWWFHRMRQVVDRAIDWQSAPTGRPEQIWLPEPRRELAAGKQGA